MPLTNFLSLYRPPTHQTTPRPQPLQARYVGPTTKNPARQPPQHSKHPPLGLWPPTPPQTPTQTTPEADAHATAATPSTQLYESGWLLIGRSLSTWICFRHLSTDSDKIL
jgi:hypothetical protein